MPKHTIRLHDFVGMTSARRGSAAAVFGTLGLAAACWFVAVRQMSGMDMGAETDLGSLSSFIVLWAPMMAAMMLPAAVPAVSRFVRAKGRVFAAPLFAGSYLAVWVLVGLAAYAVYRPHSTYVAGALTVAAGLYELTPLKRDCRERCRTSVRSGFEFGLYCVGSSIGLMVLLLALGVMSLWWMSVVAGLVFVQKLLAPRASIDVPVALAIIGLGLLIALA